MILETLLSLITVNESMETILAFLESSIGVNLFIDVYLDLKEFHLLATDWRG